MAESRNTLSSPCKALEENLVLYHYGDLEGAERAALRSHLQSCTGCTGFLKDLGALLPLTVQRDQPPAPFWTDYHRELRRKLWGSTEKKSWGQAVAAFFQPRWRPIFAAAAVAAMALAFTLGKGIWSSKDLAEDDAAMMEILPVAENLEFFRTMDLLDNLDLLESMGSQGNAA